MCEHLKHHWLNIHNTYNYSHLIRISLWSYCLYCHISITIKRFFCLHVFIYSWNCKKFYKGIKGLLQLVHVRHFHSNVPKNMNCPWKEISFCIFAIWLKDIKYSIGHQKPTYDNSFEEFYICICRKSILLS